jgi:hypothetical protein
MPTEIEVQAHKNLLLCLNVRDLDCYICKNEFFLIDFFYILYFGRAVSFG